MKFSLTLAVALLSAVFVNAQYSSAPPVTTATPPMPPAPPIPPSNSTNINVQVAPGQLVYNPPNFAAKNGTVVTFFFPTSSVLHSVTQGYFSKPCAPLAGGFDSGLLSGQQFAIKITNDQGPIFFFCKSDSHCISGMVGQVAINAPATGNTYAAYLAAAKALGSTSAPTMTTRY